MVDPRPGIDKEQGSERDAKKGVRSAIMHGIIGSYRGSVHHGGFMGEEQAVIEGKSEGGAVWRIL